MNEITVGAVVLATAGKERGSKFVVVKDLNIRQVLIADGRLRKCAHPKRKSRKHLLYLGRLATVPESNRLIWKSLSSF